MKFIPNKRTSTVEQCENQEHKDTKMRKLRNQKQIACSNKQPHNNFHYICYKKK